MSGSTDLRTKVTQRTRAASSAHMIEECELSERFGPPAAATMGRVRTDLSEWMMEFIRRSPFVVLATVGSDGACDVSPKGGDRGFVVIQDGRTLLIPDYGGNNHFLGHHNLFADPHVGLLFVLPGEGWTLRVKGRAQLVDDDVSMAALGKAANGERPRLCVKVSIDECFPHCPKAFVRSDLWDPDKHTQLPKRSAPSGGWLAKHLTPENK